MQGPRCAELGGSTDIRRAGLCAVEMYGEYLQDVRAGWEQAWWSRRGTPAGPSGLGWGDANKLRTNCTMTAIN